VANAKRDDNYNPTLQGVSIVDQTTPTDLTVDPATGRLMVNTGLSGIATETTLAKLTDVLYATEYGATYNYIMKYKRGTTVWEIQRETISTGVREYAGGDSALATAWSGRAGASYGGAA